MLRILKRIFVNLVIGPIAIGAFLFAFTNPNTHSLYRGLICGIGLIIINLQWCFRHLWRTKPVDDLSVEDFYRSKKSVNLDSITPNKIGSTLKRGSDLHK